MKILATADLHLGMKFSAYSEVQIELSEARYNTLDRLIEKANEHQCDLFLIAGDLFERVTLSKKDVIRAVSSLNRFEGKMVGVLPGNHDYCTDAEASIWKTFKEESGDLIRLLDKPAVYSLAHYDLDCDMYAGPCNEKHSSQNAISWINETPKNSGASLHIGIAHGSIETYSLDFTEQYFPMKFSELENAGVDFWIIGHTHVQFPNEQSPADTIFVPGTPEPDGFDCGHRGTAWIIEVDSDKQMSYRPLTLGQYYFIEELIEVESDDSIQKIIEKYSAPGYETALVKLHLSGSLPQEAYEEVFNIEEALQDKLQYLSVDYNDVVKNISGDTVEREFTKGSFPYELLKKLLNEGDIAAVQEAYQLIQKVSQ